tara:strand:- start:1166 stop:3166 length:2001 start_codon:yes stop_codon:yes gene_type:complete
MADAQSAASVQPAIGDLGGIRAKAVANGVGPATTVNPTSDPNFGRSPAMTVNPTSDPNFGRAPATTVNPTSDPNFGKAPATTVNPISDPGFVSDLATGQPVTENPLSDPLAVRAMEEERRSQPVTENPLSDPSFVQGLAADATTPTVNPISDPSFVQGLAADATTPTDALGAGADMAAAQNVVTPEAAPMADTLEGALRQQYMDRIGGTDDPILASQLADQQMRQNEARKALVEQLGRYGVLRGGGDTAAALARMGEGDERNRLALEAQAAQRRQQDLRDAQGFDLGQRGMGLQEGRADQDRLTQELAREVTEAGQTGQFRGGQTMAGQRQEADIFGEVDGRQTLQSDIQRGQLGLGERQTGLQERTGAEDIRRSTAQRGAIEGQEGRAERQLESQLFGEIDGQQTLTGETTRSGLDTQDLQRRIAEAGQTGLFDQEIEGVDPIQTQQARALESELDTAALGRDATRAGMTGQFEGEDTLEKTLREAGLTGMLGDDPTLAGRRADMDLIGSILAAREVDDMAGTEDLVSGLAQNLQSFTPESIEQIRRGAAAQTDTSKIETGPTVPTATPDGITVPSTGNETIDAAMDSFINREDFDYDPATARGFRTARDSKGDLIAEWVVGSGQSERSFRGKFDKKSGEFVKIGGIYGGSKDRTGPRIDEVDPQ